MLSPGGAVTAAAFAPPAADVMPEGESMGGETQHVEVSAVGWRLWIKPSPGHSSIEWAYTWCRKYGPSPCLSSCVVSRVHVYACLPQVLELLRAPGAIRSFVHNIKAYLYQEGILIWEIAAGRAGEGGGARLPAATDARVRSVRRYGAVKRQSQKEPQRSGHP